MPIDYKAIANEIGMEEEAETQIKSEQQNGRIIVEDDVPEKTGGFFKMLANTTKQAFSPTRLLPVNPLTAIPQVGKMQDQAIEAIAQNVPTMGRATAKTAIQFPQSVAGGTAGLVEEAGAAAGLPTVEAAGRQARETVMQPVNVPFIGEVKPLSANPKDVNRQTPLETAGQALEIASEGMSVVGVPGIGQAKTAGGRILKSGLSGGTITGTAAAGRTLEEGGTVNQALETGATGFALGSVLGGVFQAGVEGLNWLGQKGTTGVASAMTNEPKSNYEFARKHPDLVRKAQETLDAPEAPYMKGREAYETAARQIKKASEAWQAKETKILADYSDDIIKAQPTAYAKWRSEVANKFKIGFADDGLNFSNSAMSQDATRQGAVKQINSILSSSADDASAMTNKMSEISGIAHQARISGDKVLESIASAAKNMLAQSMDDATNGAMSAMRADYANIIKPTRDLMKRMQTRGEFDPQKATSFVRNAASDFRFNEKELLSKIDDIAGSNFALEAKAMGVARALEKLDPQTKGRVFDVLKTYVLTKLPLVSAVVSPKMWGEYYIQQGLKGKAAEFAADRASGYMNEVFGRFMLQKLGESIAPTAP